MRFKFPDDDDKDSNHSAATTPLKRQRPSTQKVFNEDRQEPQAPESKVISESENHEKEELSNKSNPVASAENAGSSAADP